MVSFPFSILHMRYVVRRGRVLIKVNLVSDGDHILRNINTHMKFEFMKCSLIRLLAVTITVYSFFNETFFSL